MTLLPEKWRDILTFTYSVDFNSKAAKERQKLASSKEEVKGEELEVEDDLPEQVE